MNNILSPTFVPNLVTLAWKMSSGMSKMAGSLNGPLVQMYCFQPLTDEAYYSYLYVKLCYAGPVGGLVPRCIQPLADSAWNIYLPLLCVWHIINAFDVTIMGYGQYRVRRLSMTNDQCFWPVLWPKWMLRLPMIWCLSAFDHWQTQHKNLYLKLGISMFIVSDLLHCPCYAPRIWSH